MAEQDPNTQKLGLDASGLEQEIDSIVLPAYARLNRETNEIVKVFEDATSHMSTAAEQFGTVQDQAARVTQTFNATKNTAAALFSQISSGNASIRENVRFWGDAEQAVQQYRRAIEATEIAQRRMRQQPYGPISWSRGGSSWRQQVSVGGERYGRNRLAEVDVASRPSQVQLQTEEQLAAIGARIKATEAERLRLAADMSDRLIGQIRVEAQLATQSAQRASQEKEAAQARDREIQQRVQFEQDWAATKARQAQAQAAEDQRREGALRLQQRMFNELRAEHEAELRSEQEAGARRASATQLGGNLLSKYNIIDPARANQISTAIGSITDSVNKGRISSERALEIFTAVERGQAQAFEGAEARVARAAQSILRIYSASRGGGGGGTGSGGGGGTGGGAGDNSRQVNDLVTLQNRYAEALKKSGKEGQEAGQKILLSWNQVVRLFIFQSLHQLVYRFFSALKDTAQATEEFEIRISEIRTISQSAQQTTEQWSQQIRQLSSEFGNPALDVAEGAYQTLSNQIAHGAEVTQFLRKALEFSKITVSSTKDAVNLLTASLNSFHMSADQTDHVAATLFKTIEIGRVRAEEMSESFGRLGALAFPLGVNLEEVSAAVATLGRHGITYNEVQTLLSNVLLKLLKPSADMQKILDKWGVSTGVAAIQTYSFVGVLRKLQQETGGSSEEMADLFKNIRAIQGALGLTGDSFEGFEGDLQKVRTEAEKTAQAAKKIAMESPAAQLKREFEALKNYFQESWGESILQGILSLTHALSDEGLVGAVKGAAEVGSIAAISWTAYQLALQGVSIKARALSTIEEARGNAAKANANAVSLQIYAEKEYQAAIALENQALQENLVLEEARIERQQEVIAATIRLNVALEEQAVAEAEVNSVRKLGLLATEENAAAFDRLAIAERTVLEAENAVVVAEQNLTVDSAVSTAAIEAEAAAHMENAEAASAAAVATGEATTASMLLDGALVSLGALAMNPLTWIVAAVALITYGLEKSYEATHAAGNAFKAAGEVAQRSISDLNRAVEDGLATQERAFKESLNHDFQAYGEFAAGVGRLIQGTVEYHKEQLREAADATRDTIHDFIQSYEDGTKKVEEVEKRSLDTIRRLEEDEEKSREDFADREFERQMKLAEFKDQQATPGGKDQKLFDQNQLKLIQDHINDLRQANDNLQSRSVALVHSGTPTSDPKRQIELKQIQDNFNLQQKNVKELEKLEDDLFNRRLNLQKQSSKTSQDLAEAEAKQKEHLAEEDDKKRRDSLGDQKREADQNFARMRPAHGVGGKEQREEDFDLKDQERETSRQQEATRAAEQSREDAKRVNELKARQAAEAESLKTLPELNKFADEFTKIQAQNNKLLEDQKRLQQEIADQAQKEVQARKAGFTALKTALEEIAKFKLDQPKIATREDLDNRLQQFDLLMQKAQQAGLTDQQILNKWIQERVDMELNGQAQIAAAEHKRLENRAQVAKAQIEREEAERKASIEASHRQITELYPSVGALVGTKNQKGEFVQGAIETAARESFERIGHSTDDAIEATKKVAASLQQIQESEKQLAEKGTPFDPKLLDQYRANVAALTKVITEGHAKQVTNIIERPKDDQGRDLPPVNLQQELDRLKASGDQLQQRIAKESEAVAAAKKAQSQREIELKKLQDQSEALAKQYGLLDDSVSKTNKSFADLSAELTNIVSGMQRLKQVIDSLQPPPNAPPIQHKALGGPIFAPRGTDTIPAMLTPGEFIVNAAATRKYYNALTRMNLYHEDGGIVPNYQASMPQMPNIKVSGGNAVTFGDFHFHVQGNGDMKQQAKELARVFKEEVRRGTIEKFWGSDRTG